MKNGKAMQGHRRLVVAVGEVKVTKRAPEGGWKVGCLCGWDGGVMPNTGAARAAYREHLRAVIEAPRKCKRCGQEKTAVEMADRYSRHICRACYSDAGNQWQAEHPAETARHRRNHHLLMKFGITLAEAETLLERQDGKCAICQNEITDSRNYAPHVDHDHVTGKVRGILCFLCNSGLGSFRDDPNRLRAAIAYLEERQ